MNIASIITDIMNMTTGITNIMNMTTGTITTDTTMSIIMTGKG